MTSKNKTENINYIQNLPLDEKLKQAVENWYSIRPYDQFTANSSA